MNYAGPTATRPRYYANDHSRDVLNLQAHEVSIENLRLGQAASLAREGFQLFEQGGAIGQSADDYRAAAAMGSVYAQDIAQFLQATVGADRVCVTAPGVLRFGERSPASGQLNNSRPARFVHIDVSDATATRFAVRAIPQADARRPVRRVAHYNLWRVLTPPPQDVPLAVCDARSVDAHDLLLADAVFDVADQPEWSFEGLVLQYNPRHRWCYYADMSPQELLVFKTNDTDLARPHHVPHSAFDAVTTAAGVVPRASIEMRAIAWWFA
jgi:hypothetical protein